MKTRALKTPLIFFLYITPYIVAPPENSTDALLGRPTFAPGERTIDCDGLYEQLAALNQTVQQLSQKIDGLPNEINAGIRSLAKTITQDVLDQVAYYYIGTGLTGGVGAGLFLYAVTRKDAGLNRKTFGFLGASGALMTLAVMMGTRPDLFGNDGHNH